jgi:hypothetical protein
VGEENSNFLGLILVPRILIAAMSRQDVPEEQRRDFYLYVDEMHSFVTLSFADILAESRKYGLSLFLTHQYIEQLHENIRAAIFGNVGTLISFRIGAEDAMYLEKEFHPVFKGDDLVNLPRYAMYLKLMIDGATSKPFSAVTMPLPKPGKSYKHELILLSQNKYGKKRSEVEEQLFSTQHKGTHQQTLFSS